MNVKPNVSAVKPIIAGPIRKPEKAIVVMFAAVELLHLDLEISAVSLGGAGIAMAISMLGIPEEKRMDIHEVIHKVEWGALLFFAGLFVMVGGLEAMGYLEAIANMIFDNFGPDGNISQDEVVLVIVLIWVSAIASAIAAHEGI